MVEGKSVGPTAYLDLPQVLVFSVAKDADRILSTVRREHHILLIRNQNPCYTC
jgi:hypothetical protein